MIPDIDAWAAAMLRASWQGGAALLAVWAICTIFRRSAPWAQCWLWRLGVLKFPACLLLLVPLNLALLPAAKHEPTHAASSAPPPVAPLPKTEIAAPKTPDPIPLATTPILTITPPTTTPPQTPKLRDGNPEPAAHQTDAAISKSTSHPQIPWPQILFTTWLLGIALYLIQIARAFRRTQLLRRTATPINNPQYQTTLRTLATTLRLRQPPLLLASENCPSPLLTGILHPAILLPTHFLNHCTPAQLRLILAHELAHLKRRDLAWNALQTAIHILFFFHPLLWLARRPARFAQELACDQLALAATGESPAAYGNTLLDVISHQQQSRRTLVGVGIATSAKNLRRRITAMKTFQPTRPIALTASLLAIAAITAILPWRVVAQTVPSTVTKPGTPASAHNLKPTAIATIELSDKITQTIPIKFFPQFGEAKGAAGVRDQLKMMSAIDSDTKVTVDEKTNSLTLTGKPENLRRIAEIIAEWEFEIAQQRAQPVVPGPFDNTPPAAAPLKPEDMPPAVLQFNASLSVPTVEIQSPLDGTLSEILVKEGQQVHQGDILFRMDDRAASAAVQIAELNVRSAELNAERGSPTERELAKTQVELARIQLKIAQNALEDLAIRSPIDGMLETFSVKPAQIITRGTRFTTVVATNDLKVNLLIPSHVLAALHTGQKFTVRAEGLLPATAEIDYIAPTGDVQANAFHVRGKLISGDSLPSLKSGMQVTVYITADRAK